MNDSVFDAIDGFYKASYNDFDEFDSCDADEANKLFKRALKDYIKIIKTCENEGLSVLDETDEFHEIFSESSTINDRLELVASIQDNIRTMLDACSCPPKDIISKYSEDLVTRIENGIIDDSYYSEE